MSAEYTSQNESGCRVIGALVVDEPARQVICAGQRLGLTAMEYAILSLLTQHPGWVISTDEIAATVPALNGYSNSVAVHISHLRQKLRACTAEQVIETVRGMGYRLTTTRSRDPHPWIGPDADGVQQLPEDPWARSAFQTAIGQAQSGRPSSLMLVGSSGSGKTATLHALQANLHRAGWATSVIDCRVVEGLGTLAPWRLLLQSLGMEGEHAAFATYRGRVRDLVGAACSVAALLDELVGPQPVLAAFDAAECMDADSLRVLAHVAANATDGSLLLVAASRDANGSLAELFGAHATFEHDLDAQSIPLPSASLADPPIGLHRDRAMSEAQ